MVGGKIPSVGYEIYTIQEAKNTAFGFINPEVLLKIDIFTRSYNV